MKKLVEIKSFKVYELFFAKKNQRIKYIYNSTKFDCIFDNILYIIENFVNYILICSTMVNISIIFYYISIIFNYYNICNYISIIFY
jgi:hypothetical protein